MREQDLPRLGKLETLNIQLIREFQLIRNQEALLLHHEFQLVHDVLLDRQAENDSLNIGIGFLRLIYKGLANAGFIISTFTQLSV